MKKIYWEISLSILFVALSTIFIYGRLAVFAPFWDAQFLWSVALAIGWVIVSIGYFRQGWIIRKSNSAEHVSVFLQAAVFVVQCILFIKGIFYHDWSLVVGALIVNSGVIFSLYQIMKANNQKGAMHDHREKYAKI